MGPYFGGATVQPGAVGLKGMMLVLSAGPGTREMVPLPSFLKGSELGFGAPLAPGWRSPTNWRFGRSFWDGSAHFSHVSVPKAGRRDECKN